MRTRSALPMLALLLLISAQLLLGQAAGTPLAIGQNALGEVTSDVPVVRFSLSGQAADVANIQVLATTPAFTPGFRVLDSSNAEIFANANPDAALNVAGIVSFERASTYTIEVTGVGATVGQFLISIQAGAPRPAPVDLPVGQSVAAALPASSVQSYQLTASTDTPLVLFIESDQPDARLSVTLRDAATGEVLAVSSNLLSVSYRLPATGSAYRLDVSHSGAGNLPITVCTAPVSALETCASSSSVAANAPASPVTAQSLSNQSINVRTSPGTEYGVLGVLAPDQPLEVIAQTSDGTWLQVRLTDDTTGWVAASLVDLNGASISDLPALNLRGGSVIEEIQYTNVTGMDPVYVTLTANPGYYLTPTALSATISPNELLEPPPMLPTATLQPTLSGIINPNPGPNYDDLAQVTLAPSDAGRAAIFADSFPDLSVYGWSINPTGYPLGTVQVLIINDGGVEAPEFQIRVCNGEDCMYFLSPGIPAHSQQLIDRPLPPRSGLNTVTITVDIDSVVTESDENNNYAVYTAELP